MKDALRLERDGEVFPRWILDGCKDALVLFAAAFNGRQDAYWIAQAGLRAVCVDVRRESILEMRKMYPSDWQFMVCDVYDLAAIDDGSTFDVVTVDCPSGHFERCAGLINVWCRLANRYVVLGTGSAVMIEPPHGWRLVERRHRSDFAGGTYWAVLGRTS